MLHFILFGVLCIFFLPTPYEVVYSAVSDDGDANLQFSISKECIIKKYCLSNSVATLIIFAICLFMTTLEATDFPTIYPGYIRCFGLLATEAANIS